MLKNMAAAAHSWKWNQLRTVELAAREIMVETFCVCSFMVEENPDCCILSMPLNFVTFGIHNCARVDEHVLAFLLI
jgi:hypothetical protein